MRIKDMITPVAHAYPSDFERFETEGGHGLCFSGPTNNLFQEHTVPVYSEKQIDYLQSKIDQLMLEYCPEEMAEEQLQEWEDHQVLSPNVCTARCVD